MKESWIARDKDVEAQLKNCTEGAKTFILGTRITACDCLNELEYVRSKFLDDRDGRQRYLYRKHKVQLTAEALESIEEWPRLLKYVSDCISECTSATERSIYRQLWNETLAKYAKAAMAEANELRFMTFGSSDRRPLERAIGLLEDVSKYMGSVNATHIAGFTQLAYTLGKELECCRELLAPESFKELGKRAERWFFYRLQGKRFALVLLAAGILIGAVLVGIISHLKTIVEWFGLK